MAKQKQSTTKTAVVYCRVSTRAQTGEDKTSLETQEKACIKHAESLGYTVGRVTKEVYSGAELWERPLLMRDLDAIKAGEFQALIVYALDRLTREQDALGYIACECRKGECELVSVTEDLDNSPMGKLLRSLTAFNAEVERVKIRERTMRGRRGRLQSGKPGFGGFQLYGYRADKENNRYEIVESEALIVRRVFDLSLSGLGCHAIASTLNREEIPSPKVGFRGRNTKWSGPTLLRILTNPSYKGVEYQWRTKRDKRKVDRARPESEWIKLPDGVRPAIVSASLWGAVQDRMKANSGAAARNAQKPVLLRGLIVCGVCGSHMIRNRFERGPYHYDKYRCSTRWRPFKSTCTSKGVPVEAVHEWVWEKVKGVFLDPAIIERELKNLRDNSDDRELQAQVAKLSKERNRVEGEIAALLKRFRKSLDDPNLGPAIERELKTAGKEKQQLEAEIARLESRIAAHTQAVVDMKSLKGYCRQVARNLETLGFNERRLALEALGVQVRASGDDWSLEISVPTQPNSNVTPLRSGICPQQNYITLRFDTREERAAA